MGISKSFMAAVDGGSSKESIRGRICRSLHSDPTCNEFCEMLEYARMRVPGLIDAMHSGDLKTSGWSNGYLGEQIAEAQENFSEKRIRHLMEVAQVVYADRIPADAVPPVIPDITTTPPKPTVKTDSITAPIKSTATLDKITTQPKLTATHDPITTPSKPRANNRKTLGKGLAVAGVAAGLTGWAFSSTGLMVTGGVCLGVGLAIVFTDTE